MQRIQTFNMQFKLNTENKRKCSCKVSVKLNGHYPIYSSAEQSETVTVVFVSSSSRIMKQRGNCVIGIFATILMSDKYKKTCNLDLVSHLLNKSQAIIVYSDFKEKRTNVSFIMVDISFLEFVVLYSLCSNYMI